MSKLLYLLTILILKLLGIKKLFSQAPVNYQKVRKGDQKSPPRKIEKNFELNRLKIKESTITEIIPKGSNTRATPIILFIPGGAFISGPAIHHWNALASIVSKTNTSAWLVDYPKAPEYHIHQINDNIDHVYQSARKKFEGHRIICIGDSVGANLIMTLTQRLIAKNNKIPFHLFLITPVFDASMSNPAIDVIEDKDPMLSKKGILSAKMMCADGMDLKDARISPLYANFKDFPATTLFLGGRDIMFPDGVLGAEKMKAAGVELELINEARMPHIYPLLPILREAKHAQQKIIDTIHKF